MPRAITNLIENTPIKLYGKGDNIRNWLYVEDYCSAIDLVITKGKIGETYLVGGSSKELTNYDVARLIVGFFGLDKKYIKFVKDRSGHDRKYAIDSTKLKTLGWQPKYDFDKWLSKTIDWYKKNTWWWRPLKAKAENLYRKTGQI